MKPWWVAWWVASLGVPPGCAAPRPAIDRLARIDDGVELFAPAGFRPRRHVVDVVVHLHGSPARARRAFARHVRGAVLLTVHRPGLSSAYGGFFADPEVLGDLLGRARARCARWFADPGLRVGRVALSAFSAGYGGVRAILRRHPPDPRIRAVVLGDGLHASYDASRRPDPEQMAPFVRWARAAAAGHVDFRLSHSRIVPGGYASVRECADVLIAAAGGRRVPWRGVNALGMQREDRCERGRLVVCGFRGTTAADHVAHFGYLWRMLGACFPKVSRG